MNRPFMHGVQVARIGFLLLLVLGTACVDVQGGAVELSWTLTKSNGDGTTCGPSGIDEVRLCMRWCDDGTIDCTSGAHVGCPSSWPCERSHGTTLFDIPAGRKALWIEVSCGGDAGTGSHVQVPEPIVRDIVEGEVTQLNALLIVVTGETACSL
jgi:hypothetical protein